jgi:hypothetical protein
MKGFQVSKTEERQRFIRYWMDETGESEVDMQKVAEMAMRMGWVAPPPVEPLDRLAKQFREAAKQDIRHDRKTGRPYRGYHAFPKQAPNGDLFFSYVDIDDPKTKPQNFKKACVMRREQTVDDLFALHLDQTHWNDTRPEDQKIELLPTDLGFDIELRLAAMDAEPKAA